MSLDTTFTDTYMLNDTPVDRVTQIVVTKPNVASLPCYDAASFFKTITSCVNTTGTFAGHPIYKAVQGADMYREGTYYYITDGKLLIEIKAPSDDQATFIAGQLKQIDDQSARNLIQKLVIAPSLVPNKTTDYSQ